MDTQMSSRIELYRNEEGVVRVVFGPHYFAEFKPKEGGCVEAVIGSTHHGFRADASEVGGQLEEIINEVVGRHPDLSL